MAEHLSSFTTSSDTPFTVSASAKHKGGLYLYLTSQPIPEGAVVKKIVFQTESHDQGWGGEAQNRGTYDGSWSWFEAAILQPDDDPVDPTFPGSHDRWHVQNNITASGERKSHTIVWDHDMPVGETGDGMRGEFNRGRECIERLRPGDRIALIATAMYTGWKNHIFGASITVYYDSGHSTETRPIHELSLA